MKTFRKITAVLLSAIIVFGMTATTAFAFKSDYTDEAIIGKYNSIDRVTLDETQQSSLILDSLDVMLAKEEIAIDIPIIGTIDLTSVDKALDSIYSITGNWLFGEVTVGDLVVLETYRSDIATYRRASTGSNDFDLVVSLVSYLSKCAPTLVDMIDKDADFSWGIVKGFLPPEFRLITDDFNKWLDELLWELIHPVNSAAMPTTLTLDDVVQFLCDNQLGGQNAATLGFEGLMPGFDVDITSDSGYRVIEEAIYQALNAFIVPLLNGDLKEVIVNGVESNRLSGGELYTIVDTSYEVTPYTFDRNKGLLEQLNDVFKWVVDEMLLDGVFTWNATTGGNYVSALEDNLTRLLRLIVQKGGESEDVSGKNLAQLGDYFARIAVNEFVDQMNVPKTATMEEVAYLGLRELCASVLPEGYRPPITDGTEAQYRAEIIELGADLGAYYLNNSIGLESDLSDSADQFLADLADWCMNNYINGLVEAEGYGSATTGWAKIDSLIWSVIPKDWIPATAMFGNESSLTFKALFDYILDMIFAFDISKLDTLLEHNENSSLNGSARQLIIDFVSRILNNAFTPEGKTACVPTGINTFDKLVSPVGNATTIICNILQTLAEDTDLQKTVLNLVVMLMGLAEPQSMSDVDIDIDGRINCTSGSINSKMRISNFSDGVNSAWTNENGIVEQDEMYVIELDSITNTAGLTTTDVEAVKIGANEYFDVTITGSVPATTEVRFDLSYYILDESGASITGNKALVKSVYTHLYTATGNYDISSAESEANNVTFEAFPTYLYTTNVYDASLFSILATNESGLITSAVDITRAIVTGTLPTGISANAPTDGNIVSIDDSSATVDSYGTVNPYVANIDPDAAQPYGIYNVEIQFEVEGKNWLGSTTTDVSEKRAHTIVIYDDFNLGGIIDDVMNENRQKSDYSADATTEWNAYLAAVSAGYALLHGNPNHDYMFVDKYADIDGVQNEYYEKAEAIKTAVAALDAKAVTNQTELATLRTALSAYDNIDREDYVLFTYDRFEDAYDRARNIVNSQTAPAGQEETFVAPAVKAFDIIYAKNQLTLWGGRLIKKTVDTRYLDEEVAKAEALNSAVYTAASWAAVQQELNLIDDYKDGTVVATQGKINATRVNLMEAMIGLEFIEFFDVVENSGAVVDYENMRVLGITTEQSDITSFVTAAPGYTISSDNESAYIGTGTTIDVKSTSNVAVIATYTVVVYGDLTGDGYVNMDDEEILIYYLTEDNTIIEEGSALYVAADIDRNGVVDEDDYIAFVG